MGEHAEDRQAIEFGGEAPTVEVIVYRDGELVHRELCESVETAAGVVEEWGELEGVECVVDDLSVKHRAGQILEPDAETFADEDYPHTTRREYED